MGRAADRSRSDPERVLIGRADERAAISRLLAGARLVTLVGPPGIGKTSLARGIAHDCRDPSIVVELAAIPEPSLVTAAIAAALPVQPSGGLGQIEAITEWIGGQRLLLVLDNCEHLLKACCSACAELVDRCPELVVLATSREPLGSDDELVWQVSALPVPEPGEVRPAALMAYPAVALFVERAAGAIPGFALNTWVAADVAEICRQLDGIPLAIELAAAQVVTITPREITRRLVDQLAVLADAVGMDPRHRTLVSAIDWSYQLLSTTERSLLDCLSVFMGPFELDAVVAICAGRVAAEAEIPDLLTRLVSKSLVVAVRRAGEESGLRFRLLETVRIYAAEKLSQAGRTAELRTVHSRFYVELAERAEPEFVGARQLAWFERIASERANFRTALEWMFGRGQGELALRLTSALVLFWRVRGPFSEGRDLLKLAVEVGAYEASGVRAKAQWGAGFLAQMDGDVRAAGPLVQRSLEAYRAIGDDRGCARALLSLVDAMSGVADDASREEWLRESVALARAAADHWCLAHALGKQGLRVRDDGDWGLADAEFRECLAVARAAGDLQGLRYGLIGLGDLAVERGEYRSAETLLGEAVEVTAALGETYDQAVAMTCLGKLAIGRGDYPGASGHLSAACTLLRDYEAPWAWVQTWVLVAVVAHAQGERGRCRQLLDRLSAAAPGSMPVVLALVELELSGGDVQAARGLLELVLAQNRQSKQLAARALQQQALVERLDGDPRSAAARYDEALALQRELGDRPGIAATLEGIAGLAAESGFHDHAARLLGAAGALREDGGYARLPWEEARYQDALSKTRGGMARSGFAGARAAGASMSVEQAVEAALSGPHPTRAATGWPSLTERELDIAWLVADGLNNPAIAEQLNISRETVKSHLVNIYAKLGVDGRWKLAEVAKSHREIAQRGV